MKERVITDTSNIFTIDRGDILDIDGKRYMVTGHERERRFGVEDPKFWVKRVIELETGKKKLVKLSYFEAFDTHLGGVRIHCFRNPQKEGDILELVKNNPNFMQGTMHRDSKGNVIRIIDPLKGDNFFLFIASLDIDYENYYHNMLQGILRNILKTLDAIRFLHAHGFRHGDIRNDHIIVEKETGNYVWIDFDYDFSTDENPFSLDLLGLGNILLYAVGKGFYYLREIEGNPEIYNNLKGPIEERDFSIFSRKRFMNLRKIYPYIPVQLNDILLHFSRGAEMFYESVEEIIEDLNRCLYSAFE